jgi:hypothetical protein
LSVQTVRFFCVALAKACAKDVCCSSLRRLQKTQTINFSILFGLHPSRLPAAYRNY